jgi:hypothetical protein
MSGNIDAIEPSDSRTAAPWSQRPSRADRANRAGRQRPERVWRSAPESRHVRDAREPRERGIPAEQLVAAEARQRDGDAALSHRAGDDIAVDAIRGRLIHRLQRLRQTREQFIACAGRWRCGLRRTPARPSPAWELSSNADSSKPIEKVRGRQPASRISATTALESMPPDRKAPTGTSLTRCDATASRSSSPVLRRTSSADRSCGVRTAASMSQ